MNRFFAAVGVIATANVCISYAHGDRGTWMVFRFLFAAYLLSYAFRKEGTSA